VKEASGFMPPIYSRTGCKIIPGHSGTRH
jgi:hypothetical protein